MLRYCLPVILLSVVLSGCTTLRETEPTQTARHQLLLSKAADRASAQIDPNVPQDNRIFVDTTNFGSDSEYQNLYAISTIKAALLRQGYALASTQEEADTIAAISSGALSIDRKKKLFGISSTTLPIPFAGAFKTPELAIYKRKDRTGVAKFLVTFYDAKTGAMQDAGPPLYGFSHYDRASIFFYGWTQSNLYPAGIEKAGNSQ